MLREGARQQLEYAQLESRNKELEMGMNLLKGEKETLTAELARLAALTTQAQDELEQKLQDNASLKEEIHNLKLKILELEGTR